MSQPLSAKDRVFVLTGAGISAESGLPTFRGADGIWRGQRAQDVATPEAFRANPEMVWQFYSERRKRHSSVMANPGHFALATLEQALGRALLPLYTERRFTSRAGGIEAGHSHARPPDADPLLARGLPHQAVRRRPHVHELDGNS